MTMFERWCILNGHKPFGAAPAIVAQFVDDIASMGIEQVWEAVQEIARMHSAHGLPDPTQSKAVAAAINAIAKIDPPRSWPAEEKLRFLTLPYDIQLIISKREQDRDNEVRKKQREFAQLKKEMENGIQVSSSDTDQAAA
jgi:hypothetical protein